MKSLVIYDSTFGNTKIIAEAISKELGAESKAVFVDDANKNNFIDDLKNAELLIAGSPIIGWKPSEKMGLFLERLTKDHKDQLKGIKAASFDTRVKIFFHGDAAKKISKKLENAGAKIITEPNAFYVKGKEGPLLGGEKEKAAEWAQTIKARAER